MTFKLVHMLILICCWLVIWQPKAEPANPQAAALTAVSRSDTGQAADLPLRQEIAHPGPKSE